MFIQKGTKNYLIRFKLNKVQKLFLLGLEKYQWKSGNL